MEVYYENGQLSSIGKYSQGKETGPWKYFHENGQFRYVGKYSLGVSTGEWKYYHTNGQIYQVRLYEKGKLMNILSCFDGNGTSLNKGTLVNGNGSINEYDIEGLLIKQVNYINGRRND